MDESTLPRPDVWRDGNRRVGVFVAACVFGLTMIFVVAFVSPVAAVAMLLVLGALALAVLQFADARVVVVRTRTLDVAGEELAATVFPYRRMWIRFGWLVVGAVGAAGVVLLVRGDLLVGLVALGIGLLGAGYWLAVHLDRRGNPPCLALCERGVVLVRGRPALIAWDDLVVGSDHLRPLVTVFGDSHGRDAIVVRSADAPDPLRRGWWRQVLDESGGTGPLVYTQRLRCDPVVVYHALRFYQRRAGTRPELGTVAARHRIEAADLLV